MSGYPPPQNPAPLPPPPYAYNPQPFVPSPTPSPHQQQQQQQHQQQRQYGGAAYFPPPPPSVSSPTAVAQPKPPLPAQSGPLSAGLPHETSPQGSGSAMGSGGDRYGQQTTFSYGAYPSGPSPHPQQLSSQPHLQQRRSAGNPAPPSYISPAALDREAAPPAPAPPRPSSSLYSQPSGTTAAPHEAAVAAGEAIAPHWQQQQQQRQHALRMPPPPREDLLGGGPLPDEDPDARMKAMVDAAARAKAAGGGAGAPLYHAGGGRHRRQDVVFVVGPPRYRVRTAILFATALFGVIPLMSTFALTVLLCGVILVYIMDFLGHEGGTVLALLGTALTFGAALLLSNLHAAVKSFGPMLMVIDVSGVLLMATAACLMHFRWLQETRPDTICMLERCVMSITPILALPSFLTTSIALVGARYGPFAFLAAMCALHHLFYGPLRSSFMAVAVGKEELPHYLQESDATSRRKKTDDETRGLANDLPSACGDGEDSSEGGAVALARQQLNDCSHAAVFTILLLFLPMFLYNFLQTNWEEHIVANLLNSLGLLCGSFTYLCITPWHSLWFLAPPLEEFNRAASAPAPAADAAKKSSGNGTKDNELEMNPETVALLLAYDPLGLQLIIKEYRTRVLTVVAVFGVYWAGFRLTNSRYAYLFDGLAYPLNMICLQVALLVAAFLAIQVMVLMTADSAGENISRGSHVARRATVIFGSMLVVVLFCALASAPGIFYLLGVLSVTSLNMFLVDRSNAGPMISFTVFSSLLLLWWMYRTFSFIVVDLPVLNGTHAVSSAFVGVSVLWSYVLGCLCFLFSFSKTKAFLVIFVLLHSLEVTFVEEVLMAQKDEGAYPAVLALLTSGLGAWVGYRFYKNEVLGIQGAAFVASCYLAKVLVLLVETTGAYYAGELEAQHPELAKVLLTGEISAAWWSALVGCFVAAVLGIEQRKRLAARQAARLPYLYVVAAVATALCTIRNVQRAAYEFLTQSYVAADELPHIAPGTACITLAALLWPFFSLQATRYPHLRKFATVGKLSAVVGALLLAVQPTRITEAHVSALDYELASADKGRYAAVAGLLMLLGSRVAPLQRLPVLARSCYWLTTAVLLAFGITAQLLPVPTIPLFACMIGFVFLTLLLIDLAHFRELTSVEGWVVYGLSFCVMIGSFIMVGRVDLVKVARGNVALVWEMHEQGRIQLLSIVSVVNLFVAILLRFRLAGKPLLPHCVPLTAATASQVGVMCNYAALFSVCTLSVLNFWANQSEPVLYVMLSLVLLLLVDDDLLFFDLHRRHYRYFPCAAFAFAALWFCLCYHGWALAVSQAWAFRVFAVVRSAAFGLPLLPAQLSLLMDVADVDGPRPSANSSGKHTVVWATMLVSGVVLLFTSSPTLTWMAIVCVCGQAARLFGRGLVASSTRHRRGKP